MSMGGDVRGGTRDQGASVAGLRFAVFTTRNLLYLLAVLAMNYTLMRPSPVDLLFIASLLMTLFHVTLHTKQEVTRRSVTLALLLGAWALSFFVASLPHLREPFVGFELLAKTFAISIGVVSAFVSMTWNRRHFETFMKVYIVSCVIASILGSIGFVLQNQLLTWDGRAKGLIDDPNMYGSFLIPAVMFCAYFLFRPRRSTVLLIGAMAILLLGIVLSFSRIAQVAALLCFAAYFVFQNRQRPRRLLLMAGGLVAIGVVLVAAVSVAPPEFSEKFLDRLTLAKSYDVGETGRYTRYMLVLPMILQNPIGVGVLQLEKIFPEPIHNIWLSSFVNYGWLGGFTWITLVIASVVVSIRNYRRTRSDIPIVLLISLVGIVMCSTLHEGEHWRHLWLCFGLVWGLNTFILEGGTKPSPINPRPAGKRSPPPRMSVTAAVRSRPAGGADLGQQARGERNRVGGKARGVLSGEVGLAMRADPGKERHTAKQDHRLDHGKIR
jgi:O-antigen ligase